MIAENTSVWVRAGVVYAAVILGLAGLPALADPMPGPFYEASPAELKGPPGSIIRVEALPDSPVWYTKNYKILYRSTGLDGQPIAVSGLMVVPTAAVPSGGHPVLAWAHPTTGVADKCAPSLHELEAVEKIPGLAEAVKDGFVVVATDYPGLGTAGEHPYLIGVSEARAVLDSVRAARELGKGSASFAVWGHSQGGHASLWTGQIAAEYAPELKLVGVAAAAPATELGALFDDDLSSIAGEGLTALTLWSWSQLYGYPLSQVVLPAAEDAVATIGHECLYGISDLIEDKGAIDKIQVRGFLKADPVKTPPWAATIAANTPGGSPPGAPVFIAQGSADTVVDPPVTTAFASKLCRDGATVRFFEVPDANHTMIAKASASAAVEWIADRFAGKPAPTNCTKK
ncbi:MAG: alpha/beta fold hydrolase [Bauldia sp.]